MGHAGGDHPGGRANRRAGGCGKDPRFLRRQPGFARGGRAGDIAADSWRALFSRLTALDLTWRADLDRQNRSARQPPCLDSGAGFAPPDQDRRGWWATVHGGTQKAVFVFAPAKGKREADAGFDGHRGLQRWPLTCLTTSKAKRNSSRARRSWFAVNLIPTEHKPLWCKNIVGYLGFARSSEGDLQGGVAHVII